MHPRDKEDKGQGRFLIDVWERDMAEEDIMGAIRRQLKTVFADTSGAWECANVEHARLLLHHICSTFSLFVADL